MKSIAMSCLLTLTACHDASSHYEKSPLDATYVLDGEAITLHGGRAGRPAAQGSATIVQTYMTDMVYGDLDADGDDDVALVLAHEPGGSGTFSYLVAAVREEDRYVGSNALFLGDRIGQPTATIRDGAIEVKFLDRTEDASFGDLPTQPRIVTARLQGRTLEVP